MGDEVEERLKSHPKAFEGLMSLIPAKLYYGEDTSDQWQRKKQTKEQKRAAQKAKRDPASQKSAKDIMDENERKRKREIGMEDEEDVYDFNEPGIEKPREGLKGTNRKNKKQKTELGEEKADQGENNAAEATEEGISEKQRKKAEKRKEKAQRKKEKADRKKERAEKKKAKQVTGKAQSEPATSEEQDTVPAQKDEPVTAAAQQPEDMDTGDMGEVDISGLQEQNHEDSASPSPAAESPRSEESAHISTSSISSILPTATANDPEKLDKPDKPDKLIIPPNFDHEALQARLQARIDALRAARKADGLDGKPARNRQELLEARRRKEEQRRASKKEARKMAKEDEIRLKAEEELARLRGSGSPSTPDIFSPPENNFSFGRIAFTDGQQVNSGLSGIMDIRKRKGPQDARTALQAAQKKHSRLSGLDDEKKADIEEKDLWLNAKKKAHGERVRDDMSLLQKALKRKQKAKAKSEKEWTDRIQGVEKGKEMKQKRREDNLQKRREEKGGKGKGKNKVVKKKGRPGFEGSFRSSVKIRTN
ncbi:SURF6-domain-containing protein [Rhizodiscina lignyota]|uniref:SURF6-domain-containing protein n=1 Tax=Rhizodiscina lignyota TaxID=1504668 RepID=A0A9P4IMY3_9PEZI|nr:SURF6-domain-containing protein [Rhizodiscina lignyota]